MVLIAFSWDDGSREDLKLMDLSLKFNIPGMFFIPANNNERKILDDDDIRKIDHQRFEIGAHTYSHKYLPTLSLAEAKNEIINGKDHLDQLLGKKTHHFCFPGGKYNADLINISRELFSSARTADTGAILKKDSFLIRPAIHFFDRGKRSLLLNSIKNMSTICPAILKNIFEDNYFDLLRKIIDELDSFGGTHRIMIWGHSWEIEQYSLWDELEKFYLWLATHYPHNLRTYSEIIRKI